MKDLQIFVLKEDGFYAHDRENFLSYKELGVDKLLPDFLRKRLKSFGFKNNRVIKDLHEIKRISAEFIAVIRVANPFIDPNLLYKMISVLKRHNEFDICKCTGAIPGTEPDFVIRSCAWQKKRESLRCLEIGSDTQSSYNCQLNLYKSKRIKIFWNLLKQVDGLERLNIDELMSLFASKGIFEKIISYFENIPLVYLSKCPHCGANIEPLRATVSQPMIGFIPDSKPYYYRCISCNLIVLSPTIPADKTYKLYDKYYTEGQGQTYFLKRECRYQHYASGISLVKLLLPKKTIGLDLGAGSGTFVYYTRRHFPSWRIIASDFPQALKFFRYPKNIKTKELNFLRDPIGDEEYDLITAWEVIEHIPFSAFEGLLHKIHKALKPASVFLFSTPDFDSPLSQAWDLYNVCPPHHLLVFSKRWMLKYFMHHPDFELIGIVNESEIFKVYEPWFKYWEKTSKNFETKALARLFFEMLSDKSMNKSFRDFLSRKDYGCEMIVAIRKKPKVVKSGDNH